MFSSLSVDRAAAHVHDCGYVAAMALQREHSCQVPFLYSKGHSSVLAAVFHIAAIHIAAETARHEKVDDACIALAVLSGEDQRVGPVGLQDAYIRSGIHEKLDDLDSIHFHCEKQG